MEQFDTIVIGFGKAGKTIAGKLAGKGERVALIEKDSGMYGGTCINVGCIPSKRLVTDAAAAPRGSFEEKSAYYRQVIEDKRKLTGALRAANLNKLLKAGVKVYDGHAEFVEAHILSVTDAQGARTQLRGEKIVINTGARPWIPPIQGVQDNPQVFVSETLLDLDRLPERLTIIGGGYIGLEFASMYAEFGSRVTMIQDGTLFLPREDRDIADSILEVLKSKGVSLITDADVYSVSGGDVHYRLRGQEQTQQGDAVLLATGRRPNTDGLHPERAGIALTERGGIRIDERLKTTAPGVWAAGDVCGNLQFTYISLDDSCIVLSDMAAEGERTTENRGAFAYSVFIDPPYAKVGIGEREAKEKGLDVRFVSMKTEMIPKAKVLRKTEGLLKAVIDRQSGHILGAALFCAEAHELINLIKLAMDQNLPYTALRDFMYTHPTIAEGLNDLFAL